jgi:hypothetical protein
VVSQHEHGSMVRRIFAPPTLPGFVRPGPSDGPKHVTTDDPCSDIVETASREIIVNSRCAAVVPKHALEGASREHPIVQCHAANTKRVLKILTWTSTVSIDGNPKRVDSELWHQLSAKSQVFAICRQCNDERVACNLTSSTADRVERFDYQGCTLNHPGMTDQIRRYRPTLWSELLGQRWKSSRRAGL